MSQANYSALLEARPGPGNARTARWVCLHCPLAVTVSVLALFLAASTKGDSVTSTVEFSHTNLLAYHNDRGEVASVASRSDWQKRRAEILRGMQAIMGSLPGKEKRCPLDVRIEEEADCGGYVRRLLTYSSEPGGRVPAYLLIPRTALHSKKKYPAVLALHPTDMEFGYRVVVEELRGNYRAYGRD